MSKVFSVSRISAAFAIIAAYAIALAMAAGTMRADGPSTQTVGVSFSAAGSKKSREARPHEVEDGSVADAVKAAKPAVFSVRVRYRAAAGEGNPRRVGCRAVGRRTGQESRHRAGRRDRLGQSGDRERRSRPIQENGWSRSRHRDKSRNW